MSDKNLVLKITDNDYALIEKYSPEIISQLKRLEADEYITDEDTLDNLLESLDDAVVRYGLDEKQDKTTQLGRELTLLFDNLYSQS